MPGDSLGLLRVHTLLNRNTRTPTTPPPPFLRGTSLPFLAWQALVGGLQGGDVRTLPCGKEQMLELNRRVYVYFRSPN